MENFTPFSSLIGGVLIGLSSAVLLSANGRIAGISGIAGGLNSLKIEDYSWRLNFFVGLILGVALYRGLGGPLIELTISQSLPLLVVAGFLTGFGTRLGSGCTSGHGICGMALLSIRSLVAVICFLSCAMLTVYISKQLIGT